jgi:hypothetical protein
MRSFFVAGALAVAWCGVAMAAPADRAEQLFKRGKKLLSEKKYAEACTAFEQSDKLDSGIGAKLNVARCYQEWGKLATAWRWYSDAEKMATDIKDDRAGKIRALIDELDPTVPRLTLSLPADAVTDHVVVKLDGVELAATALTGEHRVDPGPHRIDIIVDGAQRTRTVPVERGGKADVVLDVPVRTRLKPEARRLTPVEESHRQRQLIGLGVAGGGVVALGIAGIVTLRARGDYQHALSAHCSGAPDMCDDIGQAGARSARHRANISTVVSVVGLGAIAGGLFVYFTTPRVTRDEHALYLAPLAGDGEGVVFGGVF